MTIVFDNYPGTPGLKSLWGFSAILALPGQTVLFDTGSNGRVLLANMNALGLAPESIDLIFLSHPHWDHIGGLDSLLEIDPRAKVVVHEGFSEHLIADLRGLCAELVVAGTDPLPLLPGIWSTGLLDSEPPEHAMVIDIDGTTAAISGCAHPGMERVTDRAKKVLGRRVHWAIGGFHLMYADAAEIARTIQALQELGVDRVVPTHCTGDQARAAFRQAYGPGFVDGGVGATIDVAPA